MMVSGLFFYLFSALAVSSGAMVILARNPVHAVLFLILSFFNSAGLFVLMGAEFLAMLLVVVYVGAVAVLFLFVVMMLDIDYGGLHEGFQRHVPIGLVVGGVLLVELILIFSASVVSPEFVSESVSLGPVLIDGERTNTALIGAVLYTEYLYLFQLAGLILLVAMVGAITLTMRHREGVKRQSIMRQNSRTRAETVALISVESNTAPKSILEAASGSERSQERLK